MSAQVKNAGQSATITYAVLPERMQPIPPEQFSVAQQKVAAELSSSRGSVRGPFGAMLRSPELADCMQRVGQYVRFKCGLDKRINRLAGMLATRHWSNQYEWNGHVPYALQAGMEQALIDALAEGRRPSAMRADEAAVYDFVTELARNHKVSDETFARARALFSEQQLVDLTAVAGTYVTVAMLISMAEEPVPPGREPPFGPGDP